MIRGANGGGQSVRDIIGFVNFIDFQNFGNHFTDGFFVGQAVARCRHLYFRRRKFQYGYFALERNQCQDPPGLGHLQGGFHIFHKKKLFYGD